MMKLASRTGGADTGKLRERGRVELLRGGL